MNAILITGNTYPHRRALRGAGALFDHAEKGYIARADNAEARAAAEAAGLDVDEYDATEEQVTPATGERLREQRQAAIDRKRERLYQRAEAAERRSQEAWDSISPAERSFLSLGEPVKMGHHSQRRHEKLLDRFDNAMRKSAEESKKAEKLRRRADWMMDAQVKGDAAARRQERIAKADAAISVGDLVDTCHFGRATVLRCNKVTFTVRLESGGTIKHGKEFFTLLEKREPEAKTAPRFKKGDEVEVRHFTRGWCKGVVVRRTTRGYSCDWEWPEGGAGTRKTFSDDYVRERQAETANA